MNQKIERQSKKESGHRNKKRTEEKEDIIINKVQDLMFSSYNFIFTLLYISTCARLDVSFIHLIASIPPREFLQRENHLSRLSSDIRAKTPFKLHGH